jgi:tetratricopeptide (TPR) repeat protein
MKQAPTHPGILHFYVHLTEMSSTPEKALPAANALVGLVPDGGHLEHMPSHIYVLMGDYARAIACNERGIIADEKYQALRGSGGFYLVYRLHNMQFVVYAAMFAGQYGVAMRHVEMIEREVPEELLASLGHFIEATYAIRFQVYVRFGRWREIIALEPPKRERVFPITTAFVHWSKAIAYSATRDVVNAEKERLLYLEAYDKIPSTSLMFPNTAHDVLAIGTAFLDGELEYRKGNFDAAFTHLEESIRRYDSLVYCEPWSWLTPVRHAYAALKLERGHTEEALECYYDDLGFNDTLARANQHPNNVWALTGAYECLRKLGREREARIVWPLLRAARAVADVDVDVSCFCRIDDVANGRDLVQQGEVRAGCCK